MQRPRLEFVYNRGALLYNDGMFRCMNLVCLFQLHTYSKLPKRPASTPRSFKSSREAKFLLLKNMRPWSQLR